MEKKLPFVVAERRIPFSAASSATPFKRNFKLCYLNENHESEEFEIKLTRPRIAIALYRAITEKHAFYSCETVGLDVTKQFVRDFKVYSIYIYIQHKHNRLAEAIDFLLSILSHI